MITPSEEWLLGSLGLCSDPRDCLPFSPLVFLDTEQCRHVTFWSSLWIFDAVEHLESATPPFVHHAEAWTQKLTRGSSDERGSSCGICVANHSQAGHVDTDEVELEVQRKAWNGDGCSRMGYCMIAAGFNHRAS